MATSSDLKEALAQRLKRMEAAGNSNIRSPAVISGANRANSFGSSSQSFIVGNTGKSITGTLTNSLTVGLKPTTSFMHSTAQSVPTPTFTALKGPIPPGPPVIQCEGYLSKFSSGTLTGRWQKRYFILENGRFGYYKQQPESREITKPDKTFSLKKVKAVFTKEPTSPNEREFSLQLGDIVYQLKASTPSDMRKWLSALSLAIAHKDEFAAIPDISIDGDSSAADMISVSNSVSSAFSDTSMLPEDVQFYIQQQRVQAASAAQQHETVWEIDVDPDQLDGLFEQWCKVSNDTPSRLKPLSDKIISGLSKSLAHMLCTIAGEIYDPDMIDIQGNFFRAKAAVTTLRKNGGHHHAATEDPIRLQLNAVFIEYVPRQIAVISKFLEVRNERKFSTNSVEDDWSGRQDLPGLINIIALIMSSLSVLFFAKDDSKYPGDCLCSYCDPTGERLGGGASRGEAVGSCQATQRWRKTIKSCLQRLGSELEIGLIEDIQADMFDADSTWDRSANDAGEYGPKKISNPVFGNRTGLWMSSWSSHTILLCEKRAIGIISDGGKSVEYCKRLMSEILSSVLVAVFNSAWRQFKHKALKTSVYASERKAALDKAALLHSQNVGFWSVFTSPQRMQQIQQTLVVEDEYRNTLELENLISFTNECVLMSTFLSESIEDSLPYIPKIFASCFDGLSGTFTNTAVDTCRHIVHFHFTEQSLPVVEKAFQLIKTAPAGVDLVKSTPMIACRDLTDKFVNDLIPFGAHPTVKGYCLVHIVAAVANMYAQSLLRSRIKVKLNKVFLSVISGDIIIFKSLFSEQRFHCKDTVVARAIHPISVMYGVLSEKELRVVINDWSRRLVEIFGTRHAPTIAGIIADMRGDMSKTDRATFKANSDPFGTSSTGTPSTAVSSMVSISPPSHRKGILSPKSPKGSLIIDDEEERFPWRLY